MAKGRPSGSKNRNYPPLGLADALRVPRAIQDKASGMAVTRLTMAELLGVSPASSNFRELVASSRFYGLSVGGINSDEFGLTPLGSEATGADEVAQVAARKKAVMNVEPFRLFFEKFSNLKVPAPTPFKEFLVKSASVSPDRAEECMQFILSDAEAAGFLRTMKGGAQYIDLSGTPTLANEELDDDSGETENDESAERSEPGDEAHDVEVPAENEKTVAGKPKKVFIAHGKNRVPLDQLKKALDQFKVSYAVAVDEPNKGRPISRKVASLMQDECSSGIFIFTADERFVREVDGTTEEVWRPSENVVYELGAAAILYENRIVIFKEKGVTFPTDFSDLGYIEFEKDQLGTELGSLFAELVGLDILEVRAKG